MYRIIFTMLLAFVVSGFVLSQVPSQTSAQCMLTVARAPSVRGVKLGMTADALFALFPGSGEEQENRIALANAAAPPNFGRAHIDIAPDRYANKEKFSGIDWYFFNLFDGKIVQFTVQYIGPNSTPRRGPAWPNLDDLVAKFSETFHLPGPGGWTNREASKILKCNGFEVEVRNPSGDAQLNVQQSAPSWVDELKKRRAAEEERLRREFKP